jgi:amidohydrolase
MNKELKEKILKAAASMSDELIRLRRHFHSNPELSFREYETMDFICGYLDKLGLPYQKGIAGTGIICEISGLPGNSVIGLRAEMDALPVKETEGRSYGSTKEGVMHACGHDAHMAMLLGTARILSELKDTFYGKILLVFQPGEELSPGGARLMIESGCFDKYNPDLFIAHHVLPELQTGKVGYRAGKYMASSDEIYLTVRGKGGHAALLKQLTDQVLIASELIVEIRKRVGLIEATTDIPVVLAFGKIRGDGATNVIPREVEIAGTLRTFDETLRETVKETIRLCASEMADIKGVAVEVRIADGYPVLVNDEQLTGQAVKLSGELLGYDKTEMFGLRMSSEDFAFFTSKYRALYYRVGIGKEGTEPAMLHSATFDLDENAMITGVANMTWLALSFAAEKSAEQPNL